MNKLKKLVFSSCALIAIIGSSAAYAGSTTVTIGYYDTGKDSSVYSMSGNLSLTGYNSAQSTNQLWVELYRRDAGFDDRMTYKKMSIDSTTSWAYNANSAQYYLHLDPDGPNYDSTIGSGSVTWP